MFWGSYLEDHPRTWKQLGSPPSISHEEAIWKGSHNPRGRKRSPWWLTTYPKWDDPPSKEVCTMPICSMYGIFTCMCLIFFANVGKYFLHGASGMDHPTTKIKKMDFHGPWLVGFQRQFLWNCVPIGSIFQSGIKIRNSHLTYLEWLRSKTWWVSSYNTINHIISFNLHPGRWIWNLQMEDEYGTYKSPI